MLIQKKIKIQRIKYLYILIIILANIVLFSDDLKCEIIVGRMGIGYHYSIAGGIYDESNEFTKDNFMGHGYSFLIGISFNNFTYKQREKFGILFEYSNLFIADSDTIAGGVYTYSLSGVFEYAFMDIKKGRFVPFAIVGISLIYFWELVTYLDRPVDALVKDRHFKIGCFGGFGGNYYLTDKFAIEVMLRAVYIPKEAHLVTLILTIGISTVF